MQNSLGVAQLLLGQYLDAQHSFDQAHETRTRLTISQRDVVIARADMNLEWLETRRDISEVVVRAAYQRALNSRAALDPNTALLNFAQVDLRYADWLFQRNRWQDIDCALLRQLHNDCVSVGSVEDAWHARLLTAQIDLRSGKAPQAFDAVVAIGNAAKTQHNATFRYWAGLWQSRVQVDMGNVDAAQRTL